MLCNDIAVYMYHQYNVYKERSGWNKCVVYM